MLIYEITAQVKDDLIGNFERFMREIHIPDLLKTGYFEQAEMARISVGNYRIRYLTESKEKLEKYFATDAENLREDFLKNFPAGIEVSREILEVLQSWDITN
jgi:hypothetical protein